MLGDWTDRIAAGEIPATKPTRPQGKERNVVITVWDWADGKSYLHDEIATDKRNPTINAYGSLYGATENSTDMGANPRSGEEHCDHGADSGARDPKTPSAASTLMFAPSALLGQTKILWHAQTIPHSLMLDERSRVWYATPGFVRRPILITVSRARIILGEAVPDRYVEPRSRDV